MFKITIEETKDVRKTIGKQWEIVGKDGERGYTPEVETIVTERTEIYRQIVDDLDLIAVIDAVNKIKK
jgi:tetrahydromethanopterin S-methyltransferase subunit A